MKKSKYVLSMVISLFLIMIFSIFIGIYFILDKEKELLENRYSNLSNNLIDKVYSLINTKQNATLSIAITLAENDKIKNALLKQEIYDLNVLSNNLSKHTEFKNVWFQLIDKDGVSIYRSWTADKFDKIKNLRLDLQDLYKNPQILILDEATSALDNESESIISEVIQEVSGNKITFIIAHRLSTIKNADKIAVFKDGEIVCMGDEKELLVNCKEYQRLHNLANF